LSSGACLLLNAGQGGSGGDLGLLMVDTFVKGSIPPDAENKARALKVLRAFPKGEVTRKRYVDEMITWSAKLGPFPSGDPELHHVAGTIYASGTVLKLIALLTETEHEAYEAEKHLILGTKDSPETLANMEFEWYKLDALHTAPLYAGRAILPYLLVGNLRGANKAFLIFTRSLGTGKELGVQEVSSKLSDLKVYPSLPLLNFLGLLLLAVQRGAADLYRQLKSHYAIHLRELSAWSDALDQIGELYFNIKITKQTNPLFDMMGSLLMGGGGGPKSGGRGAPALPPAVD
jgi:golgi to ER traffic protein 4